MTVNEEARMKDTLLHGEPYVPLGISSDEAWWMTLVILVLFVLLCGAGITFRAGLPGWTSVTLVIIAFAGTVYAALAAHENGLRQLRWFAASWSLAPLAILLLVMYYSR